MSMTSFYTSTYKVSASEQLTSTLSELRALDMAIPNGHDREVNSTNPSLWWSSTNNDSDVVTNASLPTDNATATGASIVSPIVMFLAGLIGNVLALVILRRTRTEIRSMMFYTLVAALTWNDLIGIVLTSPVTLASYINGREMPAGDRLCRFNGFAMVCFGLSTPLIVCTMAIERSLALKCTYFYSKYCTPSAARVVVVALWAFVFLFGALPLFGFGSFSLQYPKTWCFLDFHSSVPLDMVYAYGYALLNLLIVVLMTLCNLVVMATLCQVRDTRRKQSTVSLNASLLTSDTVDEKGRPPQITSRRRPQRNVELQMIWLVCGITTIFAVCWIPLMLHIMLTLSMDKKSPVFGLVAIRLASLNQTLNPWMYVILRKALITRIKQTFAKCCRGEDEDSSQGEDVKYYHQQNKYNHHYAPNLLERHPRGYVHVRNQLCPSSQFVGRKSNASSLSEGANRSGESGSKKHSRGSHVSWSKGGKKYYSENELDEWPRRGSGDLSQLCSVCHFKGCNPGAGGGDGEGISNRSVSGTSKRACQADGSDRILQVGEMAGSVGEEMDPSSRRLVDSSEQIHTSRQLSNSSSSDHRCVSRTHSSDKSVNRHSSDKSVNRHSGSSVHQISEADDYGYVSKVSTDSSRMSTPEKPLPSLQDPKSYPNQTYQVDSLHLPEEADSVFVSGAGFSEDTAVVALENDRNRATSCSSVTTLSAQGRESTSAVEQHKTAEYRRQSSSGDTMTHSASSSTRP